MVASANSIKIGIGLDTRLSLGLLDQRGTDPSAESGRSFGSEDPIVPPPA